MGGGLDHLVEAVQQPPHDEGVVGAVPDAADQKGDKDIEVVVEFGAFLAAGKGQRGVDVIGQPFGEGDVPSAPEIGYRARQVGQIEVFAQVNAKQACGSDGDVAVGRKVDVDLQAEGHCRQNDLRPPQFGGVFSVEIGRDHQGQPICNDQLLEETPKDADQCLDETFVFKFMWSGNLRQQVRGALNGAGNQLGEKSQVERELAGVLFRFNDAVIDIQQVADGLEGVEGYAQ